MVGVSLRVSAAAAEPDEMQPLLLQKVYRSPEDGTYFGGLGDDDEFEFYEEDEGDDDDEEEESHRQRHILSEEELEKDNDLLSLDAEGHAVSSLPLGAKTFQQFFTHLRTHVYHTFEKLHPRYNHQTITQDPVAFVEKNPHPDLVGSERLDGYAHEPTPHPLRVSNQSQVQHDLEH